MEFYLQVSWKKALTISYNEVWIKFIYISKNDCHMNLMKDAGNISLSI